MVPEARAQPRAVRAALTGTELVHEARRRGKLMLVDVSSGAVIGLHLGMSGRVIIDGEAAGDPLVYASNRRRRVAPVRTEASPTAAACSCATRAGSARWSSTPTRIASALTRSRSRSRSSAPSSRGAARRSRPSSWISRASPGLGNLLCDEALWRAGIDPARRADSLTDADMKRLHRAIRDTLRVLGKRGGSHTGDLTSQREPGSHCPRDGAPMLRRTVGGRTTYSCPLHQV